MKKIISILSVLSLFVSVGAFAATKTTKTAAKTAAPAAAPAAKAALVAKKSFARNYGIAGCGLGSMVIAKDGSQILAATTNGTFGNQTFAISLGTSNCVDSDENEVAHKMDNFINGNKNAIASDIARGQGETLASISAMMGCDQHVADLGASLQRNFKVIFPNENVKVNDVTDSIITVIKTDDQMTGKCSKAS